MNDINNSNTDITLSQNDEANKNTENSNILKENGFLVTERDLNQGNDFLKDDYSNEHYEAIVTNPPFDLWDAFVEKSKTIAYLRKKL